MQSPLRGRCRKNFFILAWMLLVTIQPLMAMDAGEDAGKEVYSLASIRDATVFITLPLKDGNRFGSGLYVQSSRGNKFVLTNASLVEDVLSFDTLRRRETSIQCSFHSGSEKRIDSIAEIVAIDQSTRIALLSLASSDATKLPSPLPLKLADALEETASVTVLGYPFGTSLASNVYGPALTAASTTISGLRTDDENRLQSIQLAGGVQSGNQGGPVVNNRGELVGVVLGKIPESEIGFVVPGTAIVELWSGSIKSTQSYFWRHKLEVNVNITFEKLDPDNNIANAEVVFFPYTDDAGRHAKLAPNSPVKSRVTEQVNLEFEPDSNSVRLAKSLPVNWGAIGFQIHWKNNDQTEKWSEVTKIPGLSIEVPARRDDSVANATSDKKDYYSYKHSEGQVPYVIPFSQSDVVVDQINGDIFSLDANSGRLLRTKQTEFDGIAKSVGTWTYLPSIGKLSLLKRVGDRRYFFAASRSLGEVYIVDADEMELKNIVSVRGNEISRLVASLNPNDPHLYIATPSGVSCVDLNAVELVSSPVQLPEKFMISNDGDRVYCYGQVIRKFESQGSKSIPKFFTKINLNVGDNSVNPMDPLGRFLISRNSVIRLSDQRKVKDLSEILQSDDLRSMVFSNRSPLAFLLKTTNIQAWSTTAWQQSKVSIPLPMSRINNLAPAYSLNNEMKLVDSGATKSILFCINNLLVKIPYSQFEDIHNRQIVTCSLSHSDFKVGVPSKFTIRIDPPEATISVESIPDGVIHKTISDRELQFSWTPSHDQVGEHKISIRNQLGEDACIEDLYCQVSQPFIESPLHISQFAISDDAKAFVVVQSPFEGDEQSNMADPMTMLPNETRIAFVPTSSKDGHHVIAFEGGRVHLVASVCGVVGVVSKSHGTQVQLFSTPDLRSLGKVECNAPIVKISAYNELIQIETTSGFERVDLKSLNIVESKTKKESSYKQRTSRSIQLGETKGYFENGVFYSNSSEKWEPLLFVEPRLLPVLGMTPANSNFIERNKSPKAMYGDYIRNPTFTTVSTSDLDFDIGTGDVIMRGPLGHLDAYCNFTNVIGLVLTDCNRGFAADVRIASVRSPDFFNVPSQKPTAVFDRNFIYVGFRNRIYRYFVSEETRTKIINPTRRFAFVPKQSTFVLSETRTKLKHSLVGYAGGESDPLRFTLTHNVEGVSIDQKTGDVTCDREELMQKASESMQAYAKVYSSYESMMEKVREIGADTQSVLDVSIEGLPIRVPIHIKAENMNTSEVAELKYHVILDFPLKKLVTIANLHFKKKP